MHIFSSIVLALLVPIEGDRILLSDIFPDVDPEIATLDLGAAPAPGTRRALQVGILRQRIREAKIKAPIMWPRRIVVSRSSQTLNEIQLRTLLRERIEAEFPQSVFGELAVTGGVVLPAGEIEVEIKAPKRWKSGSQYLSYRIGVENSRFEKRGAVRVEMDLPPRQEVVKRGDRLSLVAQRGSITIRARAVAQQDGAIGERIAVLPLSGKKLVQAWVRSAQEVGLEL